MLEVNLSLYPVLVVGLSGDVPERTLLRIARAAKNAIEQAPGVLAAELRGARDEAVEIIIEPTLMHDCIPRSFLKTGIRPVIRLLVGRSAQWMLKSSSGRSSGG